MSARKVEGCRIKILRVPQVNGNPNLNLQHSKKPWVLKLGKISAHGPPFYEHLAPQNQIQFPWFQFLYIKYTPVLFNESIPSIPHAGVWLNTWGSTRKKVPQAERSNLSLAAKYNARTKKHHQSKNIHLKVTLSHFTLWATKKVKRKSSSTSLCFQLPQKTQQGAVHGNHAKPTMVNTWLRMGKNV